MILAALAGVCIALQASANGAFRGNLKNEWYAAFFSICGTFLTAVIFMAIYRPDLPEVKSFQSTQWWNWIGGPLGAMIVLAGASLTPKLGAGLFISLVVGGQLLCSVLLDHFALMGLPHQPISWGRIIGVILVIAGVVCIKYL
jgi:transporter family-2 protein